MSQEYQLKKVLPKIMVSKPSNYKSEEGLKESAYVQAISFNSLNLEMIDSGPHL